MESKLQLIGGRKFLLAILSLVTTALLAWLKVLDPSAYTTVVIATVGSYIAGNVVQKSTTNKVP